MFIIPRERRILEAISGHRLHRPEPEYACCNDGTVVGYYLIMQANYLLRKVHVFIAIVGMAALAMSCGTTKRLLQPEPDWIYIDQAKASHIREKDVYKVDSYERFAALKLYVYHRGVHIKQMDVFLMNGDILRPAIDGYIKAGDRSRTIELAADGKQVKKIVIRYRSEGKLFSDKALIQVAGLRSTSVRR